MPKFKRYFCTAKKKSVGTTEEFVDFDRVDPGEAWVVTRVGVYNSHATQTLDVYPGILDRGTFHRLDFKDNLAAKAVEAFVNPIFVTEGNQFRVGLTGSGSTTTCEVTINGFVLDISKEE